MSDDKLTEALTRWDAGETVDGDMLRAFTEAARRWRDFPTDDDIARIAVAYEERTLYAVNDDALRAALEAVKREAR